MSADSVFPYHKGAAPMMWVLFAIALIELVVVHLLVALKWPWIGWPLTVLSAIGTLWILVWIHSFRSHPHVLRGDGLTVSLGRFKTVEIAVPNITLVKSAWEQGALKDKAALNLAGIAFPNRCLVVGEPIGKGKSKIYLRLDDAEAFDRALENRGVPIE